MTQQESSSRRAPVLDRVNESFIEKLRPKPKRRSDTNGRYRLTDMHVPPGGGPPPHRHDFEETFVISSTAAAASGSRGDGAIRLEPSGQFGG